MTTQGQLSSILSLRACPGTRMSSGFQKLLGRQWSPRRTRFLETKSISPWPWVPVSSPAFTSCLRPMQSGSV